MKALLKHGGWRPDYTWRLARRGQARFTGHYLHAHLEVTGPTGTLRHPIVHYSYRSMDTVLEKLNRYSSASARDMISEGRKSSFGRAIGHGLWAFVRTYFLRLGFLDGRWGFIFMLAFSVAEGIYYRQAVAAAAQAGARRAMKAVATGPIALPAGVINCRHPVAAAPMQAAHQRCVSGRMGGAGSGRRRTGRAEGAN